VINQEIERMNSKSKINGGQFLGERQRMKLFRHHRRMHNPMLVLNMSIFNSGHSWERLFSPLKVRENVG
jgi:hypothetical protein